MTHAPLTFESLLADPLTRLVMASDGVTEADLITLLHRTRHAVAVRPPMKPAEILPFPGPCPEIGARLSA